jgi:hypothetical protein
VKSRAISTFYGCNKMTQFNPLQSGPISANASHCIGSDHFSILHNTF